MPTREGWLYLAVVLDLASRRVVWWAASVLNQELALSALNTARRAIGAFIDVCYNQERRHPSLGFRSRVEYERHMLKAG